MDRLSVTLAISRGRRLYHGQPFAVFALDLRDPLGAFMARLLHGLGDTRSVDDLKRRAELRERAPIAVVPSSLKNVARLPGCVRRLPGLVAKEGCTAGDLDALRAFVRGARAWTEGVPVFLAADQERTVFRFPLDRRTIPNVLAPIDPLTFGPPAIGDDAEEDDDLDDDDDELDDARQGSHGDAPDEIDLLWESRKEEVTPPPRASSPAAIAAAERNSDGLVQGFTRLARAIGIGWIDALHRVERAVSAGQRGTGALWTPSRIAAWSDDDILDGLAALGIETDRSTFLEATAGDTSAFPHAIHRWVGDLPNNGPDRDTDFVVLAGITLWKRWRPERPCREALLLRWMDGNAAEATGDLEGALGAWVDFGDLVWKAAPEARSPRDIAAVLKRPPDSTADLDDSEEQDEDWHTSFEDFLANVVERAEELAERAALTEREEETLVRVTAYLRDVEARLPGADPDLFEVNAVWCADLLDSLDRYGELLDLARATIAKAPKSAAGYAWLARSLALDIGVSATDREEGLRLVRRALPRIHDTDDLASDSQAGDLHGNLEMLAERVAGHGAQGKRRS